MNNKTIIVKGDEIVLYSQNFKWVEFDSFKRKAYKIRTYLSHHSRPQYDLFGGNAGPFSLTLSGGCL